MVSARVDRYNHDIGEDTDDAEESNLFGSFSSFTPQYKKVQSRLSSNIEEHDTSTSSSCRKFTFRCDSDTTGESAANSASQFTGKPIKYAFLLNAI